MTSDWKMCTSISDKNDPWEGQIYHGLKHMFTSAPKFCQFWVVLVRSWKPGTNTRLDTALYSKELLYRARSVFDFRICPERYRGRS